VDATNFIAYSESAKEALKSANLLKKIAVNVLIEGEEGVGKKTLATHIVYHPNIFTAQDVNDGRISFVDFESLPLVISGFNEVRNLDLLEKNLKEYNIRLIATSSKVIDEKTYERFFSAKIVLPPIAHRKEDIKPLVNIFLNEAKKIFGKNISLKYEEVKIDTSRNCHSLKLSVFYAYIAKSISGDELKNLLEIYFEDKIGGKNDYRDLLHIFEVPLLRVSMRKFKSQLQVAEKLGLNRNTLRKKLQEYDKELD